MADFKVNEDGSVVWTGEPTDADRETAAAAVKEKLTAIKPVTAELGVPEAPKKAPKRVSREKAATGIPVAERGV